MNPSGQNPLQLSPAQQLQVMQQAIQQIRAELAQSKNMTQQVTQALNTANQNNAALRERLQARITAQGPQVKLESQIRTKERVLSLAASYTWIITP